MKILVTGGSGFIGSHIVDNLINLGNEVIVIDNLSTGKKENINPKATFFNLDICSSELNKIFDKEVDAVIHLAAQISVTKSIENPLLDAKTNIIGTLNVLENCRTFDVKKFIYCSSAAEVGIPEKIPIDEDHKTNPISPYGISKHVIDYYLKYYFDSFGIKYTVLRYSNVYGPRQDSSGEGGVVSIFVNKLINNEAPIIYGDGEQTRDFVYVKDIAEVTCLALNNLNGEKYNVGTEKQISINFLFSKLKEIIECDVKPDYQEERMGDIRNSVFDVNKIKKDLRWEAKYGLIDGLSETINYFQKIK